MQIDIDPDLIGMRYPFEVNLLGDAKSTLQALSRCWTARRTAPGGRRSMRNVRDWWEVMDRRADVDAEPLNPERVFRELLRNCPTTSS